MNISGLDKAEVLAALFNASRQQGISFLDPRGRRDMTKERAAEILKVTEHFDYLEGQVIPLESRCSGRRREQPLHDLARRQDQALTTAWI